MLKRLIKLVISLCFYEFCSLWRLINRVSGKKIAGSCVVLLYHKVSSRNQNRFRKQVKMLRRFAEPIAASNNKLLEEGTHYAVVTFDDGLKGILENAVPELLTFKIPLTVFVPTGYLGRNPGWLGWIHNGKEEHDTEVVVDATQLKALDNDLITIGSHGVNHLRLTALSEEDAKKEIAKSKDSLESIINKPVELFAFPYGAYTEALVNTALQKGYKRVFTALPKLAFSEPNEVITGRIDVSPDDWQIEFILKLLGAYRWLPVAFFVKSKILNIYNHIPLLNNRKCCSCNPREL